MSAGLIGTNANSEHAGDVRIKSILLTAGAGGNSVLTIYPYKFTSGAVLLQVATLAGTSVQVFFDALHVFGGLSVVPDANSACYVIEYE